MRLDKSNTILLSPGGYPGMGGTNELPKQGHLKDGGTRPLARGLRRLRLDRDSKATSYGFTMSGDSDNGTGFFISGVTPGSVAERHGLKAGDQLLEVGGWSVSGASHSQVAEVVQRSRSVTLLLRDVGVIPVKDSPGRMAALRREGDPLTWVMVDGSLDPPPAASRRPQVGGGGKMVTHYDGNPGRLATAPSAPSAPSNGAPGGKDTHLLITIPTQGRSSLGFSIKHDHNGFCVATVKPDGPAWRAGLRHSDHILTCNGKDLSKMDHKMAVVEMKKHPHIVMEVRRPFKKPETRAGESSGYNSSASSTTGDQTPPVGARRQVERRPKERVTSRLSAVSHRLEEREQKLRSVEGEWANAEAAFKRRQLASHHPHRDQTKQSGGRKSHPMSRSASDLLDPTQYDSSDQSVYYTSAINPNTGIKTNYYSGSSSSTSAAAIRPASSTTNLLNYQEVTYFQSPSCTSDDESSVANTVYSNSRHSTIASQRSGKDKLSQYGGGAPGSHKIALVTTCDPHVNNIVVTATRHRDEKDAVSRLEQLSCSSNPSSLQTGCPKQASCGGGVCHDNRQVDTTESVDRQLKLIQEQKRLLAEQEQQLVREKTRCELRRGTLLKTNSAPLGAVVIPCVGDSTTSSSSRHNSDASSTYSNFPSSFQRHLSRSPSPHCSRSPPSPTPSSASARHTSRIHIKSSPPAPPKRNTSTTLTRQQRDCCCGGCCHHNQHHPSTRAKHSSLTRQKPHHQQQHHCYDCNTGSVSRTYSHNHHHHTRCHHSPPSSPSSSSGISCGSNPHHNSLPRRCKSFDELSHSSNEDAAIWDDIRHNPQQLLFNDKCQHSAPKGNIPPPPLPNLLTQSTAPARTQPKMSSSTSSTPSLTPPADAHKSDLASALTLALRKRKIEASYTGDDSEKADAYQAKIDAYKKEKVVPKDAKKMQLEKLMEEFKQKHSKMFNAEDEPSSSVSSSSSSDNSTPAKKEDSAPKLESFTIPRTELSQINVIPRKAASPVRTPSTLASAETVTPKKIPLGYTKSQAPAPPSSKEQFASKIVMRSQSSTLKNVPEKRHTVHVSSFNEEDGEGENTNPLQYWKKKDEAVKKPRPTTAVVAQPSIKTLASTIVSFNAVTAYKKNPLAHTAVEIKSSSNTVQEEVNVDIHDTPEKLSASDLIKTFNASSSTLKKNSSGGGGVGGGNVSNIYLNRLKPANTKPKAPQPEKTPAPAVTLSSLPSPTTIVEPTKPPVQVNWVSASTNTNRSSHLVKQQVSPDNNIHGIPPPPPLPPNYSKQQSPSSCSYQSLTSTSLSSPSYQSSSSPPHQEGQHYSPISISIGGGGPSSTSSRSSSSNYPTSGTPKHVSSSSRTSKDGGYYGSSSPIAIVGPPPVDSLSSSFDNISPSDLIIPRPPSPMSYSTVIPKGVPPPPRDSWNERHGGGHNSSIVHISHSTNQESSAEEKSFQKRFNAKDNTSTNFKALFTSQKSQEETKPLVRIDSYSSNSSRPGPQKIDFLAAAPTAPSFQEEEEELQASDAEGYEGEGSSIGSDRVQFQNELSNTLTRSNLRQRYSPNQSSVSSSDSDSDP